MRVLLTLAIVVGVCGFLYFSWISVQAIWLSATPGYPLNTATRGASLGGVLALMCLLLVGLAGWALRREGQ